MARTIKPKPIPELTSAEERLLAAPDEELTPEELAAGRRLAAELLRGAFAHIAPGRSLVDELIAERRAIARAESADYSQRQDDGD